MDIDGILVSRNNITTGTGVVPISGVNVSGNVISSQTATSGSVLLDLSHMRRTNGTTRGGTNTSVIIYGTAAESNGSDITYVNSAANGDSFTINTTGIYSISTSTTMNTTNAEADIRIGTLDNAQNDSKSRAIGQTATGTDSIILSWIGPIVAGQSVWVASSSALSAGVNTNQITITRLR